MKSIQYLFFLIAFSATLASCDSLLDLEPAQSISEELALENDANIKAVLVGAYDELGADNLFGGNTLRNSELLGANNEVQWVGTFNGPREIWNLNMIAENGDVQGLWIDCYQTINIANNVLAGLDVVNEADKSAVEGEALFIRAMVYFELVRFYAKPWVAGASNDQLGVPVVLAPTRAINEDSKIARSSVSAVYAQIISDLTQAKSLLPESNSWRADSYAASAALARVYLQQGDFAKARDEASRVIASGRYALMNEYADAFNRDANSPEDIFSIQVTSQDGVNSMITFFAIPDFGGRDGDIDILDGHLSLYNPADERLSLFYEGNGAIRSGKWTNQFGNVALFRLAEMYLIRAECNARLGTSVGDTPLNDYNKIHQRAGLPAASSVTVDDILYERRLELAHEGFKVHDLRRLKQSVQGQAFDADRTVFPIPGREINANPNLVQNPGY